MPSVCHFSAKCSEYSNDGVRRELNHLYTANCAGARSTRAGRCFHLTEEGRSGNTKSTTCRNATLASPESNVSRVDLAELSNGFF